MALSRQATDAPLNKERRSIPLRLDNAPINGSLARFLYINGLLAYREQAYPRLVEAFRPTAKASVSVSFRSNDCRRPILNQ